MNRLTWILVLLPILLCSCASVGIEKPKYTVVEKQGNLEVRQYPSQIVAETLVEADFKEAGNIAFGRLFGYISGKNRTQESIKMTAPVSQAKPSEKIAMTAPVTMQPSGGKYAVSFVMPSKYTMDTIPQPLDDRVVIKEIPAGRFAAVRYSGTWSQKRYEEKKVLLDAFIQEKGLTVRGEPVFARYNPPFELWFLRRNEVLVPVE